MVSDLEKDKNSSEFHNQLAKLIEEYNTEEKGLEPFDIMDGLISQFKIEACVIFGCYYHALGMCTEMLNAGFEEMFYDINSSKEE